LSQGLRFRFQQSQTPDRIFIPGGGASTVVISPIMLISTAFEEDWLIRSRLLSAFSHGHQTDAFVKEYIAQGRRYQLPANPRAQLKE
jgi:hypothetical protein